MGGIFSSQRFGKPQIFAGLLLLVFLAECAWLVAHEYPGAIVTNPDEMTRIEQGLVQWHGLGIAGTPSAASSLSDPAQNGSGLYDPNHSPSWYLISSAPVALFRIPADSALWVWLTRAPYVIFGMLLGASLWYVSRRLYGNAGGYIALALYCFSPSVIRSSALWVAPPNIAGAWGTFGAVFTASAVSHTLYAPREVVIWNWRRIVLLGVSLALAIGSQFALAIMLPALLLFMLYLAPERKAAAVAILTAASAVGLLLLFASYFFHPTQFAAGIQHARFVEESGHALAMSGAYLQLTREMAQSGPVLLLLIPAAFATYILWPRTRYFGNAAPLIIAVLFLALRVLSPHDPDSVFSLTAAVFLFVFIAGIAADLLQTTSRDLVTAVLVGLLAANGLWNLIGLARVGR